MTRELNETMGQQDSLFDISVRQNFAQAVVPESQAILTKERLLCLSNAKNALNSVVNEEQPLYNNRTLYFASEKYQSRLTQAREAATTEFDVKYEERFNFLQQENLERLSQRLQRILVAGWKITLPTDPKKMQELLLAVASVFEQNGQPSVFPDGRPNQARAKVLLDTLGIPNSISIPTQDEQVIRADQQRALSLGLYIEEFIRLRNGANSAFEKYCADGPFYGLSSIAQEEPTFRVAAEPVLLPLTSDQIQEINLLGEDIYEVGRVLPSLPGTYKSRLGIGLDYRLPLSLRLDTIYTLENGVPTIKVNEIEPDDGASALAIEHERIYKRQQLENSTAGYFVKAMRSMYPKLARGQNIRLAAVTGIADNPYVPNTQRFADFVNRTSGGLVNIEIVDTNTVRGLSSRRDAAVDLTIYDGVCNDYSLTDVQLQELNIPLDKVVTSGMYNAIGIKGIFAMIFDSALEGFWKREIGQDRLKRLQKYLIPSQFISDRKALQQARKKNEVVKVFWAPNDTSLLYCSNGVFGPWSSPTQWNNAAKAFDRGASFIAQSYVRPAKLPAFLRADGGKMIEQVSWYNRVCIKFCTDANPNDPLTNIAQTAIEVTLGPDVVPAGRACAFTAGEFVEGVL